MPGEPFAHLRMLVSRIVVDDGVDRLSLGNPGLDDVKEANELLMPVVRHAAPGHLAFQDVESGEQGGGAMTFVVMGHSAGPSLLHRQARLGSIEGLDLALLVDREDNGMIRGIDIEADNVLELGGKGRIIRQLELPHLMGLEAVRSPDALDRADAYPDRLGHGRRRPVGRLARRGTGGEVEHARSPLAPAAACGRGASCRATDHPRRPA